MGTRPQLHSRLKTIAENVYFQPPVNLDMDYPCIVYKPDTADTEFADNVPYRYTRRYMLTSIEREADSLLFDQLILLPQCRHDRFYVVNNLYHNVFLLYF